MKLGFKETCLALGLVALSGNCCEGPKESPQSPEKVPIQSPPEVPSREEITRKLCRQYALNVAASIQGQIGETTSMVAQVPSIAIKEEAEKSCLRNNRVDLPPPGPPPMFERSPSGSRIEHTY